MGATVKMVCQAHGGNPLAQVSPSSRQNPNYHQNQVIWFKNNQRIDHSYTTTGARSENTFMFLAQVSHYHHMSIWNLESRMCSEDNDSTDHHPRTTVSSKRNLRLFKLFSLTTTMPFTDARRRTGWWPRLSLLRSSCLFRWRWPRWFIWKFTIERLNIARQ